MAKTNQSSFLVKEFQVLTEGSDSQTSMCTNATQAICQNMSETDGVFKALLRLTAMDQMSVSLPNSYVEILAPKVKILGSGAFEK